MGEVLDCAPEDLSTAELLVLIAIAEDARDRTRLSNYSDAVTLQSRTRLAPGTIRNALSKLVRRGLVEPTAGRARIGKHQEYRVADLEPRHRNATGRVTPG